MESEQAIVLNITDDEFAEGDELISLQLNKFSSYITIGQQSTLIQIQDNDGKQYFMMAMIFSQHTCACSGDSWIQ